MIRFQQIKEINVSLFHQKCHYLKAKHFLLYTRKKTVFILCCSSFWNKIKLTIKYVYHTYIKNTPRAIINQSDFLFKHIRDDCSTEMVENLFSILHPIAMTNSFVLISEYLEKRNVFFLLFVKRKIKNKSKMRW